MRVGLAIIVLLICGLGIGLLAFDVARRIEDQSTATGDMTQWTLSQMDVELLALNLAVASAEDTVEGKNDIASVPKSHLDDIRKRFNIFFSRIATVANSQGFEAIRATPEFIANYPSMRRFLDGYSTAIDGSDEDLTKTLSNFEIALDNLRPKVRAVTLAGLQTFSKITQDSRTGVERTLIIVASLTSVFILMLLVMVVLLMRLDAVNRARTNEVASTADRLSAIIATAQDAVVTVDSKGRIVDYNAAAELIFGHVRREVIGAAMDMLLFPPADRMVLDAALEAIDQDPLAHPGDHGRLRLMAQHQSGRQFPVELSMSMAKQGRLVVAFLRDLTDQVAAEKALVDARDKALAGERAKAELLAVMSHEMRTPLNGMLGTLELMDTTRLSTRQKQLLRIVETSGRLLLNHVNDVLDISRLDSGVSAPAEDPVDLSALAGEVFGNQSAMAMSQSDTLVLELPEDGRVKVLSDARLLKQVLLNLVGNAVKFTQGGTITLKIRHLGADGPTEFSVSDTGIGISDEDQRRIFDDFVTLDASYSRTQGGTGLGLGIATRIAKQLGGQLAVRSTLGQGSTFSFAIPLTILAKDDSQPVEDAMEADALTPTGNGLSVLIVEDNEINRFVLGSMLQRDGHRVAEAVDGAEGVRMANECGYDLILTDISMPNMDGVQATKAIRGGDGPCKDIPIVAVTAHALEEEIERFHAGGMTDILVKPISQKNLRAVIARVRVGIPEKAASTAVADIPAQAPMAMPKAAAPKPKLPPKPGSQPVAAPEGTAKPARKTAAKPAAKPVATVAAEPAKPAASSKVAAKQATKKPAVAKPATPKPAAATPASKLVDSKVLKQFRSSIGAERADRLIGTFLSEGDATLIKAADLVKAGATEEEIRQPLHKLAGSAGLLGAKALRAKLAVIEDDLKAGAREAALSQLPAFEQLWSETAAVYRATMVAA